MKRRKKKEKQQIRGYQDTIKNHIDGLLTKQDLETPIKLKTLVRKQLTFSTSTDDQISEN